MVAPTITACILARNEEAQIEAALQSLVGWTDQLILIDNESRDRTAEIAADHGALVLSAPHSRNFDGVRNLAIPHATGDWIFYLDADEPVPPALGPILRRMVQERGDHFEALYIPFKNRFCEKWMEHSGWWPGYTRPQLLKKGCFRYNDRLHSGVQVNGRELRFPADPDLSIDHHSYLDLGHYLEKLNRYTDGEAENLRAEGGSHTWQACLAEFVHDWGMYYHHGKGWKDGMHGFLLAFLSATYRFLSRVKLWDLRRQKGELLGEGSLPRSVADMLAFMRKVAEEGAEPWVRSDYPPPDRITPRVPDEWLGPARPAYGLPEGSAAGVRITACILARNEEDRIEDALRSLQGWTAQIIVIDNESEDGTPEIARRYADRVLSAPQAANFDSHRNLALEHAEGEWIFFLDADERVPAALAKALLDLLTSHGDEFDALYLPSSKELRWGTGTDCSGSVSCHAAAAESSNPSSAASRCSRCSRRLWCNSSFLANTLSSYEVRVVTRW